MSRLEAFSVVVNSAKNWSYGLNEGSVHIPCVHLPGQTVHINK
jgi:hypothetical protein